MRLGPVLFCAGLLAAQTPPEAQDQCRVEGTVLNSVTGQPVPRVVVTLRSLARIPASAGPTSPPAPAAASSNSDGRFAFTNLAPGSYQISAQRDNFQYVPPHNLGMMTLNAGDRKSGVVVQLTPFGAIAGHVQNEEGDPLPNVQVNVMVYDYMPGGRQLVNKYGGSSTNDLGDYRIFGLASGKYLLRAATNMGRPAPTVDETYIPLYYPGVADPSGAAFIELAAGQDMRGVDFTLRRVHGVSVRGHAVKPSGAPVVQVSLSPAGGAMGIGMLNNGTNDPEGKFELRGVTPGAYTLTARTNVGNEMYLAERPLQVGGGDIDDIELVLAPPVNVSGVVRIEGDTTIKLSQIQVSLQAPRQGNQGRVNDDATFEIRNLMPEVYRPAVNAAGVLFIKSAHCGTTDVTESGIDLTGGAGCDLAITLSANGGQIQGQVQDDEGQPAAGAWVTLVAQGTRRDDLFKQAVADANGNFKFPMVPPASYRLYAWEEVDGGALRYDPDFIKPYESQGQSVQISEGDKQTVTLKRIPKPPAQ
jgi:protocatechuate 3,4-dioxygenase beta subunit